MKRVTLCLLLVFVLSLARAQEPVTIRVDANAKLGPLKPIWAYVGYDEPNYTYMKYGPKLITELQQMNLAPVYFHTHLCWSRAMVRPR